MKINLKRDLITSYKLLNRLNRLYVKNELCLEDINTAVAYLQSKIDDNNKEIAKCEYEDASTWTYWIVELKKQNEEHQAKIYILNRYATTLSSTSNCDIN